MIETILLIIFPFISWYLGIKRISKKIIKKLIRNSLGYIKNIDYSRFNYFTLTLHKLNFDTYSTSVRSIEIPSLKIKLGWKKLNLIFPETIFLSRNNYLKLIKFEKKPILECSLKNSSEIKLSHPVSLNIYNHDNNTVFGRKFIIEAFRVKNIKSPKACLEFLFDGNYISDDDYSYQIHIEFQMDFGISERSKARYLKSLTIKKSYIKLKTCKISNSGFLDYYANENPLGNLTYDITNPNGLKEEISSLANLKLKMKINRFIDLMLKEKSDIQDIKIMCDFLENGVFINSLPLSQISDFLKK